MIDCHAHLSAQLLRLICTVDLHGMLAAGEEGALRLTDVVAGGFPGLESGILEIFHAGAWNTLCNGDFRFFEVRPGMRYPHRHSADALVQKSQNMLWL